MLDCPWPMRLKHELRLMILVICCQC